MWSCLAVVARSALVVVFALSVTSKLRPVPFSEFATSLSRFSVPVALRRPSARTIVGAEVLLVGALLVPQSARVAGGVAALMLLGFAAALGRRLAVGDRAPCHCFGASAAPLTGAAIVRNLIAAAAAALVAVRPELPAFGVAAVSAVAGVILGLALVHADRIAELFRVPVEVRQT